ncbi:MAG: hypothetical protein K9N06_03745 [Candidatus Cloacimonetes bacterium]|nr:hypothetical protein [Candidatus Cloacimonadota bacterium]
MKYILLAAIMLLSLSALLADETAAEAVKPEIVKLELVADTLVATITIPETMHMAKQEDFVYIDIEPVEGVILGETIWSDGGHPDEFGVLNYEKQAVLKRQITLSDTLKLTGVKLVTFVGYQMCYATYCEPPQEVEIELDIPGIHCGKCPGKK